MTIGTRALTVADASAYYELRLAALKGDPRNFTSRYEDELAAGPALAEQRLANPLTLNYGAFADDRLVGLSTLVFNEMHRARHKASLVGMYVTPELRSRRVGGRLVEDMIAAARRKNPDLRKIMLEVVEGNDRAVAFYERLGFETFAVEPMATRWNDGYLGETMMARIL